MSEVTNEFRRAVSAETGVPECFLTGDTTGEVWDAAERLARWKASTAPQPPTAAVGAAAPYEPIRAAGCVPDGDWLTAWRTGKLAPVGMPAPPQRAPRGRRGMPW